MFQSIWQDIKNEFRYGTMLMQIIIANCIVFVVVNIIKLFLTIPGTDLTYYSNFLHFFCMPADLKSLLTHPWSIITSGFLHEAFGHIFWNMLMLYWFGRVVGDLIGNRFILPIYTFGVIVGNLVFFFFANFTPYSPGVGIYALGASAGVMAMVGAAAIIAPDYIFNLILIGPVKLKYIALVLFMLDIISISNSYNAGGSFAHIGGAAFGIMFANNLGRGRDWSRGFNAVVESIQHFFRKLMGNNRNKNRSRPTSPSERTYAERVVPNANKNTASSSRKTNSGAAPLTEQERLDAILDKISQKGYSSLNDEEKDFLFKASKK